MKTLILILSSVLLLATTVDAQVAKAFYDDFELLESNSNFTISYKVKQDKFYTNPDKILSTTAVEKRFILTFYVKNNRHYPIYIKEPMTLTVLIGNKEKTTEVKLPIDFIPMGNIKTHRVAILATQTPFVENFEYKMSDK